MKHLKSKLAVICCVTSLAANALAQTANSTDLDILPFSGPNMNDVVVDSSMTITRSDNDSGTIDINVYCFGTNLRSVANPLSPNAKIQAYIDYVNKDGDTRTAFVEFSAAAATSNNAPSANGAVSAANMAVYNSGGGKTTELVDSYVKDSLIRVRLKNTKTIGMDVLASGVDFGKLQDINARSILFKSVRFQQVLPPGTPVQQYMGKTGPLSAAVKWVWAENGKKATIYAGFPGENHFCGGYFSPLVLAFDDEQAPNANKSSSFVLDKNFQPKNSKISWPTFNREMYFLALDKNKNGVVDNGDELFGDIGGYKNGFESLASHDLNKDGVIDAKDEVFSQLTLWKDSDHNGVCKKSEVRSLASMGVKSINLSYKNDVRQLGGGRGSLLGPGEFSFVDKKGVSKRGWVWDIFLSSVPK